MERIEYAGGSFLTGSEISASLLAYAAALAKRGSSVALEVPARDDAGNVSVAHVLVGPASQFISLPEASDLEELVDDDFVSRVKTATLRLGTGRAEAVPESESFPPDGIVEP
jgi:hypothetical protein